MHIRLVAELKGAVTYSAQCVRSKDSYPYSLDSATVLAVSAIDYMDEQRWCQSCLDQQPNTILLLSTRLGGAYCCWSHDL